MKYTYVNGDDWEGIYIDDILMTEGHSIRINEVIQICIQYKPTQFEMVYANLDWLAEVGNLPDNLKDVKIDS